MSISSKLWDSSKYDNQIFTCSLQFAEFQPSNIDYKKIGKVKIVFANTPKSWNKYAVHIIEPVMKLFPNRDIIDIKNINLNEDQIKKVKVRYKSGISAFSKQLEIYDHQSLLEFGKFRISRFVF